MESFVYYFWTFMFGAFAGVVTESIWCVIKYHKLESRKGLIFGPLNPLYGCATVALSLAINSVSDHSAGSIFITGTVIASAIEYACSYYQEKICGTVSWNYKNFRFNLNGRINLLYSIVWGLMTIVWYNYVMPLIDLTIPFFMENIIITYVVGVLVIIDCVISLVANIRRKQRRDKMYAKTKIGKHIDYFFDDELMNKIYPNAEFTKK